MHKFKKLVASLLFVAAFISVISVPALANDLPIFSDWAKDEVKLAKKDGLISIDLYLDCSRSITRENATVLMVNFVEVITGKKITDYESGTFSDTSGMSFSVDAEKAYAAGIIRGVDDGTKFMPYESLTREECAMMLYRAVCYIEKVKSINILTHSTSKQDYSDWNEVLKWTQEGVNALVNAKILKGYSKTTLSPKDEASIEQAIVLLYRCSNFINKALENNK